MTNCPFYGRHMYRNNSLIVDPPFLLLESRGNQCGLVTTSYSPCILERDHQPVEWRDCPLMKDARMRGDEEAERKEHG